MINLSNEQTEINRLLRVKPYIRSIRRIPELRKFPGFTSIMSKWEEILIPLHDSYVEHFIQMVQSGERPYEDYGLTVDFNGEDFVFVWNIHKMNQHINETHMRLSVVPVNSLFTQGVYKDELYDEFIPKHPENPIMVISDNNNDFKPLCINGNHRVRQAYENRVNTIEVYIFNGDSHALFMETKFQELFWKFLSDMRLIEAFVLHSSSSFSVANVTERLNLYKEI